MRLTADRLLVVDGETVRATALVRASKMAIAVAGGLTHLRHALEDVGFHDVALFEARPAAWEARALPATPDLTWIVWLEATPSRTASLSRDLTEELSVTDAWPALEADMRQPLRSAYATSPGAPRRLVGFVVVFGVAYPLAIAGVA